MSTYAETRIEAWKRRAALAGEVDFTMMYIAHDAFNRDMARLIYSAITSLDGYIEDDEGKFDWAAPDEEVHAFVNDLERQSHDPDYLHVAYRVVARGTARAIAPLSPYVAGKTGTTEDAVDGWFVGFTNDVTIAVWVGYDNADRKRRSLGSSETGARVQQFAAACSR